MTHLLRRLVCWLKGHSWELFEVSQIALKMRLRACGRCGHVEETACYRGQYPLSRDR